jgi:hypothetical protein
MEDKQSVSVAYERLQKLDVKKKSKKFMGRFLVLIIIRFLVDGIYVNT